MRPWYDDGDPWCEVVSRSEVRRTCAHPLCALEGVYRAPKSQRATADHIWLCLEHVRAYNAGWDYAKGLTPAQIEHLLRRDVGWQRDTQPLGAWRTGERLLRARAAAFRAGRGADASGGKQPVHEPAPPHLRPALALFHLTWPLDPARLRRRYLELVKTHHPDRCGGSQSAEARLKVVTRAYADLSAFLKESCVQE